MRNTQITQSTAEEAGHEKRPLLKAVRAKCLDCCNESRSAVSTCQITACDLWPYRFGTNPFHTRNLSPAQAEQMKENLSKGKKDD